MADRVTGWARRHLMLALFSLSDRLCAHRWSFAIGHQVGELGWRLRHPRQPWKAQADIEAWGGRGPSASYEEWLAEGQAENDGGAAG